MPEWKKIWLGDAPTKSVRYYVDLALIPIALVSVIWLIGSVWSWPPEKWNKREAWMAFIALSAAVAIARERVVVVGAAAGFICLRAIFGVLFLAKDNQQRVGFLAIALVSAVVIYLLLFVQRKKEVLYESRHPQIDLFIGLIALAVVLFFLFRIFADTVAFYLK